MNITYFTSDCKEVNKAYYTAVSDVFANIQPMKCGFAEKPVPVLMAGMGYSSPWTRDAAINTINAAGYLCPEIARNTMLSVTEQRNGKLYIGGEYWDCIIWVWGAWKLYLYTGDTQFLRKAYEAAVNSIELFEQTELDKSDGLFRGAACYGDGVSAYPDIYAAPGDSAIMAFAKECRDKCAGTGEGIPMKTLSTNCLYYNAYVIADLMAVELGKEARYESKAKNIKQAINSLFWNESKGYYNYIIDPFGGCDSFEGLGNSFAILAGIAEAEKTQSILNNAPLTKNGIACLEPSFSRYKGGFGRHCGTVWPHVQGFWADAAAKNGRFDLAMNEFKRMTDFAVRDGFFAEIYHPESGEIYGGLQECEKSGICEWESEKKQTWSATAYLHILFANILGMKIEKDGVHFSPHLPSNITKMEITGLVLRGTKINITVCGSGTAFAAFDGGEKNIEIKGEAK